MISEGRGTTRPFELIGPPWIEPNALARALNGYRLPGVHFRPASFEPTSHKFAKEGCGGVQIHVTDRRTFEPVLASTAILHEMRQADPAKFTWRPPPYEYEREKMPIDILFGSSRLRETLQSESTVTDATIKELVALDEPAWWRRVQPYLLYE